MRFAPTSGAPHPSNRNTLTPRMPKSGLRGDPDPALAGNPGCAQAFARVDVLCFQMAAARLKIVPCYLSLLARVFQQTVKPRNFYWHSPRGFKASLPGINCRGFHKKDQFRRSIAEPKGAAPLNQDNTFTNRLICYYHPQGERHPAWAAR
jgi:hypothetical protein